MIGDIILVNRPIEREGCGTLKPFMICGRRRGGCGTSYPSHAVVVVAVLDK